MGKTRSLIRQEKRKRGEDGKDAKDNVAQFHMKKKRTGQNTGQEHKPAQRGGGGGSVSTNTS